MGSVQPHWQIQRAAKPESVPDNLFRVCQFHIWETTKQQWQYNLNQHHARRMGALKEVRQCRSGQCGMGYLLARRWFSTRPPVLDSAWSLTFQRDVSRASRGRQIKLGMLMKNAAPVWDGVIVFQ
ncbi:hypothetical protein [Shimia gijangensis]|uniref:hypothetical protein n=1 Tax=Shimia gijangensis TaxID=1470563 RepID=UPI0015881502|nr:hypothetical protein [Shimia gijangensis]